MKRATETDLNDRLPVEELRAVFEQAPVILTDRGIDTLLAG